MVFDQDKKTYGFYLEKKGDKLKTKEENSNMKLKMSWSLIVILLFVSVILGYFICVLLKKLPRRLKANELEDDFTYSSSSSFGKNNFQETKNKDVHDINNKNNLYENL